MRIYSPHQVWEIWSGVNPIISMVSLAIKFLLADRPVAECKCVENKRRAGLILFPKNIWEFSPLFLIYNSTKVSTDW